VSLIPFRAEHLALVQVQEAQTNVSPFMTYEHARALETTLAFTYMVGGAVLGVGGLVEMWPGRATMWAYLSQDAGRHFVGIHRAALALLEVADFRRVEADVGVDFAAGHRWLQMLGFKLEAARMRSFLPTGGDSSLYARVK
jgi:hypothetical protein